MATTMATAGATLPAVLVLASTFPRWAGDTTPPFVQLLCEQLAGHGYTLHVLAPHAAGAAPHERLGALEVHRYRYAPTAWETLAYGGGILENLRERPARWGLVPALLAAQARATLQLMRRHRYALVHAHWVVPQGLVSAALATRLGVPLLLSAHGGDVFAHGTGWRRSLVRYAASRHTAITVNSRAMQLAFEQATGRLAEIIPMGVDLARFQSRRPGAEGAAPRILFVGRLVEKKGVEYLIDALPALLAEQPALRVTVVGDGPRRGALATRAEVLGVAGALDFIGARPHAELPALYARADVFVAPSVVADGGDTEALGVVLLEAAAAGLPIVTTAVGGTGDIIADGRSGRVVPPRHAAALATAILELLRGPAQAAQLGAAARAHVEAEFGWASVAARFAATYRRLLGQ